MSHIHISTHQAPPEILAMDVEEITIEHLPLTLLLQARHADVITISHNGRIKTIKCSGDPRR